MMEKRENKNTNLEDSYTEFNIDPATIPGISREAIVLANSKGKFQLFNQKNLAGATLDISKQNISYRNPDLLKQFISPIGNILSRRISGVPSKKLQKLIAKHIKIARQLAIIHYPGHDTETTAND